MKERRAHYGRNQEECLGVIIVVLARSVVGGSASPARLTE
jgi:hypothetical protein